MSDPYAAVASVVYGPGSPYQGQPVSPNQAAYAGSAGPPPTTTPPGSAPTNPQYDTPGAQGAPNTYHVDQSGHLNVPPGDPFYGHGDPYAGIAGVDPNSNPNMSTAEDMGRSAVSGVQQGLTGLFGTPAAMLHLVEGAADKTGKAISDFTGIPYSQDPDVTNGTLFGAHVPNQGDYDQAFQAQLGPYHAPQTEAGKYTRAAAQFAPGLVSAIGSDGATAPGLLSSWLAPAAASETAGELTAGTPFEPWARAGGALLGGGGVQGVRSVAQAPARLAGRAMADVTPTQVEMATQLMQGSPVRLTTAEAIQQVTGGATGMGRLQHFWENSIPGGDQARQFFAQRPAVVQTATSDSADTIAPPTTDPSMLGVNAQTLGKSLLNRSTSYRTQQVNPLYEAANPQTVPQEDMDGLLGNISAQMAADKTGILAKPLGDLQDKLTDGPATAAAQAQVREAQAAQASAANQKVTINGQQVPLSTLPPHVQQAVAPGAGAPPPAPAGDPADIRIPITDIENLDRTRKFVRDNTQAQIERGRMTPEQGAVLNTHLDHLDSMMENYSPEFQQGKQLYGDLSDQYVTPLQAGPIGKIAATPDLGSQTRALYPAQPPEGTAGETSNAIRMMTGDPSTSAPFGGQYPQMDNTLAAALSRQHFVNTADTALSDLGAGPNQWGGSGLAKALGGTAEQRNVLSSNLDALPNGPSPQDLGDFLTSMQATGKRMPAGSLTAFNQEMRDHLGIAPSPVRTLSTILDPLEIGRHLDRMAGGMMYRNQVRGIGDIMLPAPGEEAAAFARAKSALPQNSSMLGRLLLSGGGQQSAP